MDSSGSKITEIDLREYLNIVWRHKWIVIIAVVSITVAATGATIIFSTPKYQSSTQLLQRYTNLDRTLLGADFFQQNSSSDASTRDLGTTAQLIKSPAVTATVSAKLGSELEGRDPAGIVRVSAVNESNIIDITATDANANVAADVANTYASAYIDWQRQSDQQALEEAIKPIEAQIQATPSDQQQTTSFSSLKSRLQSLKLLESMQTGNIQIVNSASASSSPVSPRPKQTGLLAFSVSLILGVGATFVVEVFDNKVRSADEVISALGKPVLAEIPRSGNETSGKRPLATLSRPTGRSAEAFRVLKTNLDYIAPDSDIKTIMITSAEPRDGKSSTIANLAVTMARSGQRVILLEGDLRRPVLAEYLGLENVLGMTNVIVGNNSLRESLQMLDAKDIAIPAGYDKFNDQVISMNGVKPLYCSTSGPLPPNPGELVSSDKLGQLITEASQYADIVLIDAPPFGAVGDAASMASKVDGIIVTVMRGKTAKKSLKKTREFIASVPCSVLGVVVTGVESESAYGYGYYA